MKLVEYREFINEGRSVGDLGIVYCGGDFAVWKNVVIRVFS